MGKTQFTCLGLMSGTSLDGVDAAIIHTDGEQIFGFGNSYFRAYGADEKNILHRATQAALAWNFTGTAPAIFAQAEDIIHKAHDEAARALMSDDIDVIGFHGQTLIHRPPENATPGQTLQIGDAQKLAGALGVDVAYDFRSHDMQAGGQGAPLAPIYHQALLGFSCVPLPAAVLNIGGVSNISLVDKQGQLFASDCGPGNGPLDSWVQKCGLGDYDKDGRLAGQGRPDFALVERWLTGSFFNKPVPKSADRWDFDVLDDLDALDPQDGAATLVAFCALAVARTLGFYGIAPKRIIVCGGGRKNKIIMAALRAACGGQSTLDIVSAEHMGWRGDDLEAQAFGFLAARCTRGLPLSYPGTTGVRAACTGGRIAYPDNKRSMD